MLIAVFTFIAFASGTVDEVYYWMPWAVLVTFLSFGLLLDWLFTSDADFLFDPSYDNWRRRIDPKY